jgi:heme-degrading monooxygenase HmoA
MSNLIAGALIFLGDSYMIARVWRGVVNMEKQKEYLSYLTGFGFEDYQKYPGFAGAYLLHRSEQEIVHILFISHWNSRQSIADYAGEPIEKAHYYAYDLECLIDPSPTVEHYEVIATDSLGSRLQSL